MEDTHKKICFVMQQVTPGTHMDYVYEMARTLREDMGLPLTLVVEKGVCKDGHETWCTRQRFRFAPLRILENFVLMARMRATGHRVFYIHYSFVSAFSAGLITKLCGGTVYYWNAGMPWLFKRGFIENAYQRTVFRLIDRLVTGAASIIDGYVSYYGIDEGKVTVIPNWIDLGEIHVDPDARTRVCERLNISDNSKILLYVHKLAKRKGAHLLTEILSEVRDQNAVLIIAGDGEERAYIEAECARRGLSDRVRLPGYVPRHEVEELLQAADVFVMPSEEEGSPHSLIEAMAYQVPFVTFDVGGVKETAPKDVAAYVYPFGDIEAMASGITQLLTDRMEYERFQEREKSWVARFSKGRISQEFKSLLTNV